MFIINFLAKKLKFNPTYVFRSGSWIFLKNGVSACAVFLVAVIAANVLSPDVYGAYKYLISIGALAAAFSLTGANGALARTVAQMGQANMHYLFKKVLLWSMPASTLLLSAAFYYFLKGNNIYGFALIVFALAQPFAQAAILHRAYLNGMQQYKTFSITISVQTILIAVIVSLTMYITKNVLAITIVGILATTLIYMLWYIWFIKKYQTDQDYSENKELLSYAKRLSIVDILGKASVQIENILAFQLIGPAALATYAFAKAPTDQIVGQSGFIKTILFPRYSQSSLQDINQTIHLKALGIFLFATGLIILYIFASPFLFAMLFPSYSEAILLTQILVLMTWTSFSIPYREAITAKKKMGALYTLETISPIFQLTVVSILTVLYGLVGLAAGVVIGALMKASLTTILFYKTVKDN